jgi:hypothetical protein
MDRLVSGAWLEKQLGAPDLRILDCTKDGGPPPRRSKAAGVGEQPGPRAISRTGTC